MTPARSFVTRSDGSIAVGACIGLAAMIVAGGMAMAFSLQFNAKKQLQKAIDSAVLAGTSMKGAASDDARVATARTFFEKNVAALVGKKDDPTVVLKINGTPLFQKNSILLTGDVEGEVYNPLGGMLGSPWMPIKARAAARKQFSDPVCVLGLNGKLPATMDFNGHAELNATNCAIQANSDNGGAIRQVGQPMVKGTAIGVTGSFKGSGFSPAPTEGTEPIPDPYAQLPFPPSDACKAKAKAVKIQNTTVSIAPGTHCGGLDLQAGAVVTFEPGIHVFKNGALSINSGADVKGDKVLLAFTGEGSTLYMNGSAKMTLTSPVSGTYANMQFMADRNSSEMPWGVGLVGNITLQYDGAMYFPGQNIWIGGGSIVTATSPSYAIVGDKVWVQDQSVVTVTQENTRDLEVADAKGYGFGAVLVE